MYYCMTLSHKDWELQYQIPNFSGWANFGRIKFSSSPFTSKTSVIVQTSYIETKNFKNCSCFCHIINTLLIKLTRSVWENLDLGCVYRPHCVWSVLTTLVKILPYRPPARLIRAKYLTVLTTKSTAFLWQSAECVFVVRMHQDSMCSWTKTCWQPSQQSH